MSKLVRSTSPVVNVGDVHSTVMIITAYLKTAMSYMFHCIRCNLSPTSTNRASRNCTNRVYLDYASATPVCDEALRAMHGAEKLVGNSGSIHREGVEAKRVLEKARTRIAAELGCKAREVIFTSGITESNNLAILGCFKKIVLAGVAPKDTHWIVSAIEHSSVLACFNHIEEMGGAVSRIVPDSRGIISAQAIQKELRAETVFVSVGWANNEIGTIQPLSAIGQVLREYENKNGAKIIFHTDVGQGPLYQPLQVHSLRADLLSFGSAKLYGPHGIGALFVGNRAELAPIILGGGQERELRSGTENVALAVGFAEALAQTARERDSEAKRLTKLRNQLAEGLVARISGVLINGDLRHALPHMLNVSIPEVDTEYLMLALDQAGIAVSTKSACNEGDSKSHVVEALGGEEWRVENTLRFSLGRDTTASEIKKTLKTCLSIIADLSPR